MYARVDHKAIPVTSKPITVTRIIIDKTVHVGDHPAPKNTLSCLVSCAIPSHTRSRQRLSVWG